MTLKQILDSLAGITGLRAPTIRLPYGVALCAGAAGTLVANITGRPPRAPLEGVRMARYKMWASSAKAARELGYQPGNVEEALRRAVAWFRENGFVQAA
jgi:dihydroflavonol-4-reductase